MVILLGYNLYGINDFRFEEISEPELEAGTVLVSVKAAGICGSDIPRVYRTGTYSYPLIPGHEFSGVVEQVGESVDAGWTGRRVGVFPLIPCRECPTCQKKQYEMCRNYSYLGSRTNGGFAEYVRVPEWNLLELPDDVTLEQAAMLEPMAVAVHAIRKAQVNRSDTVAVCGLGTIGLFVAMFLKDLGCQRILGIGNKESQKKLWMELGLCADDYCDSTKEDVAAWTMARTNEHGVDIFFECVGKNETVLSALDCVIPAGKIQLVGNPAGDMEFSKADYWKLLRKQLTFLGTWNSSYTHEQADDWHYVLERLQSGSVHPELMITHRFPLEDLRKGFELMRDKTEDYVKVMWSRE